MRIVFYEKRDAVNDVTLNRAAVLGPECPSPWSLSAAPHRPDRSAVASSPAEALNSSSARTPTPRAGHEPRASRRVFGEAWGDGLDHLSSAHGPDRPPADRARRGRGGPAGRAARGSGVACGTHEPPAAGGPNMRARGLRLPGEVEPDLQEWNYGAYEGRTTADIHAGRADWDLFRDGCREGSRRIESERGPTG
jgi:hypothetical protein